MASKKLITFYVSQVVEPIKRKLSLMLLEDIDELMQTDDMFHLWCYNNSVIHDWTNEKVDSLLKYKFHLQLSKIEMTNEELQELIVWSFQFADSIGLELNYPEDELDKLINLNI